LKTSCTRRYLCAQILQVARHDRPSGVDDGDVIGNLIDIGEMV
jgi:hypothetical protein